MGSSQSHPTFLALDELLRAKGAKLKKHTIQTFLEECDKVAPWFAVSGHLTPASWDRLGKDLDFSWEQSVLKGSTRAVWKLVNTCLEDERCCHAVETGKQALEQLKEERSLKSEKVSSSNSENGSEEDIEELAWELGRSSLYPDFTGLKKETSEEQRSRNQGKTSSADLKDYRRERRRREEVTPTAPPPYQDFGVTGNSFCPDAWKEVRSSLGCFPVFLDQQGNRYHEPLDFKVIKNLAESCRAYGVSAACTTVQLEALQRYCLTPSDWAGLVKACLSPGQYLDWKAFLIGFANEQAATNAAAGNQVWDRDMLLGQGRFAQQQAGYPPQVYEQINQIGIRAWKSLPNRGEVSVNLTKIIQGATEHFADFVARMVEAAGRIFGDPDAAMPLVKQLVFEQCTKESRTTITPYKNRGIEAWICRELGGPLSNAGLAAGVMQLQGRKRGTPAGACFHCGWVGHVKKDCPERSETQGPLARHPGLCTKCRKGNHWASECRSGKDINGQPLVSSNSGAWPKNGQRAHKYVGQ
ncbi:igE-binding protein-like [Mus caroli]|uniref:IgE-binding protein-like n=1 Tax=Mus caroli TaxID=10089 RepID=A0A6P5PEE9_MUSCR|nr:igE-binding protein-like [Mus caroli]